MNYYEALQRESDKRWDYTRRNDGHTSPIGYCCGWTESTREELVERHGEHIGSGAYEGQEERRKFQEHFHDDGHGTADEACECYKRYLLDNQVRLDSGTTENTQHRCEMKDCDAWTQKLAMVEHRTYLLCDAHRNMESLRELVTVGMSFGSY